jgi:hypothetical protein
MIARTSLAIARLARGSRSFHDRAQTIELRRVRFGKRVGERVHLRLLCVGE